MINLINLPVLPIKHKVPFPSVPLILHSVKSPFNKAIYDAERMYDGMVIIVAERDEELSLHTVGVICKLEPNSSSGDMSTRYSSGAVQAIGVRRVRIIEWIDGDYLKASFEEIPDICSEENFEIVKAYISAMIALIKDYSNIESSFKFNPQDFLQSIDVSALKSIEECRSVVYLIAQYTDRRLLRFNDKQKILESEDIIEQMHIVMRVVEREIFILQREATIRENIRAAVAAERDRITRAQIEHLRSQLNGELDDVTQYEQQFAKLNLNKEARQEVESEIKKLRLMSQSSAESIVSHTYLKFMASLPWGRTTKTNISQSKAEEILEKNHYGAKMVKRYALEFVALEARIKKVPHEVFCFVGQPGTGKTTMAISIAKAMGREVQVISCGGMTDEADLRGHRRTYVGAMEGMIIKAIRNAGTEKLVIVLDEIGSISTQQHRGNAVHTLREILDPVQNKQFRDHYVGAPYSLEHVLFICTANSLNDLPDAIIDRLLIYEMDGYSTEEKEKILRLHLLPKMRESYMLSERDLVIPEDIIKTMVDDYTNTEAGVRNLSRAVNSLGKWTVRELEKRKENLNASSKEEESGSKAIKLNEISIESSVSMIRTSEQKTVNEDLNSSNDLCVTMTQERLKEALGEPPAYETCIMKQNRVGSANGMGWTSMGGMMIPIEVISYKGTGKMTVTGNLGKVMKESVQVIMNVIKANSAKYGIPFNKFAELDIVAHLPSGAVFKDGPSAGVTLFTALLSAYIGFKVNCTVAMTGEVDLYGQVLAIGGLKSKIMAAIKNGIKKVLIPEANKKDIKKLELPENAIEIVTCSNVDDLMGHVFSTEDLMQMKKNADLIIESSKNQESDINSQESQSGKENSEEPEPEQE